MPYTVKYGLGDVTPAEAYSLLLPRNWAADQTVPGIVFCHGYGDNALAAIDGAGHAGQSQIARRLAEAGYPVLGCDLGGTSTWGYTPVQSRINDAITYLQSTVKAKAGKVALVGISMGGCNALVYAANNPANVSCLVGVAPVNDLQSIVTNNTGGLAAAINAVYPSGYSDATYGATYNPTVMAASGKYAGIAVHLWQGSSDGTVNTTPTFYSKLPPATSTITYLPGGHAETTWSEVDPGTVINFLKANA